MGGEHVPAAPAMAGDNFFEYSDNENVSYILKTYDVS